MLGEFDLIARYFAPLAAGEPGARGLLDDTAALTPPPGLDLVVTTDTMVAGVHFLPDDPAPLVALKLLAVNLSDLAAAGAVPWRHTLSLALNQGADEPWVAGFAAGLGQGQSTWGSILAGGDTVATPGPTTLTLTALGLVGHGGGRRRDGGTAGDVVFVSGTVGDAGFGLECLRGRFPDLDQGARDHLISRYRAPTPRIGLGSALGGLATAAVDVSDGLMADLGHLCAASGCGAEIEAETIPLSEAAKAVMAIEPARRLDPLGAGDDYELLFAAPEDRTDAVFRAAAETGVPVTAIGRLRHGGGVSLVDGRGRPITPPRPGYRHF